LVLINLVALLGHIAQSADADSYRLAVGFVRHIALVAGKPSEEAKGNITRYEFVPIAE
jgi:hypothetical protein